ncbi:MAG TPA: ATP-binding cassette domain-containing protein [Ideonella sp.]|uniref:ATP-binding cassette domain-containing protein n=1 Tax=Ideonella sp. TaxID=1929293 RepID=UPI002B7BD2E0|nr:ATP-binding cassette domain-containing protein [Ideonella sp.]HSI48905.1 ATP-binding cassette domain-containing protein [Ideonella sp.]
MSAPFSSADAAACAADSAAPLDVGALARSTGTPAPARDWHPWRVVRRLWQLFATRPMALLGGLTAALLRAGLLLGVSIAIGKVVGGGPAAAWAAMTAGLGLLAAAALGYLGQRLVIDAVHDGLTRLRERLVERLLALPVDTVRQQGAEHFVLAMTRDGELLNQMARACFGALLPGTLLVLLCLGGIAVMLPALTAPLLIALGLLWLVRRRLSHRLAGQMALAHEAIDQLYEQMGGTVLRHEVAVSHANELHEQQASRAKVSRTHALTRGLARTQTWVAELDALALGLVLLGLVAWLALAGGPAVSGPSLASVLFLLLALRGALQGALRALQEMAQGVPALASIERLLALQAAPAHHGQVPPTHWRVTLEGVSRRVGARSLVRDLDLALEPGRITVLTGPNGAGKTTLLRLLLGLNEAEQGTLRVDGVPWAQIDRSAFRRGVGHLPQNPVLFAGSVYDNLAYAVADATPQTVQRMATAVGLGPRLAAWPEGLHARLGPGGSPLSGGERQRVALARVLLRMPRLLVLDEPTNHLDGPGSQGLMALLRQLPGRPAVLVISHDPAVMAQADRTLELVDGRLQAGPGAHP